MDNLINFYDGCLVGDELWFSNLNFNALMKMNITTGKTEFVDRFPNDSDDQEFIHIRVMRYEDCLYFIPYRNKVINIWNLVEFKWEKTVYINCSKIENAFLYNDEIWLFPALFANPIIKYNLKDEKEIPLNKLTAQINEVNSEYMSIHSETVSLCGDQLVIAAYKGNVAVVIDCKTEQIINKCIFGDISISGIKVKDNKRFWVWFANSSYISLVNHEKESCFCIDASIKFHCNRTPFSNMIDVDEYRAIVLPRHADDILLIDILNNEMSKLKIPNEFKRCKITSLLLFYKEVEGTIILFPCGGNKLLVVDTNTMNVSHVNFIVDYEFSEYAKKIKKQIFDDAFYMGTLTEEKGWTKTLPTFLDKVYEDDRSMMKCDDKNVGNDIFNEIKNILL